MDNMQNTISQLSKKYYHPEDFKKDLESKIGHYVDINIWLQARPKKPLPWTSSNLEESLLYVKKSN
jgi:hypothetical protein